MINAYEKASERKIAYEFVESRPGDIASCYADPKRANELLGWVARRTLSDMCISSWGFQQQLQSTNL